MEQIHHICKDIDKNKVADIYRQCMLASITTIEKNLIECVEFRMEQLL